MGQGVEAQTSDPRVVTARFDVGAVGRWTPDSTASVTRAAIAAYSAATGEEDPRLLAGDLAPIAFGAIPSWDMVAGVFRSIAPPEHWSRAVHGEHLIESSRPLAPGDVLRTRASVVAVKPVSTGTVVVVEARSRESSGHVLVAQRSTAFFIGVRTTESAGEVPRLPAPPHAVSPADGLVRIRLETDEYLPRRYADASGDRSAIHLDAQAAREIGLAGPIVHGMCLLALASRAVASAAAGGDPSRLRSIACRFADVAYPGRALVAGIDAVAPDSAWFTLSDDAGRAVLTNGHVRMGPPAAGHGG